VSDFSTQLLRSAPRLNLIAASSPLIGIAQIDETAASAVYPAANRALYYPVLIDTPMTFTQMATYNGATAKGKIDVGIYDETFERLVNIGLTAQSGTSTLQLFNIADTTVNPGLFYFAITCTSAEATFLRGTVSGIRQQAGGVFQQALGSEVELPKTATPAGGPLSSSYIPLFFASANDAAVL
jgi:hypothetical protein